MNKYEVFLSSSAEKQLDKLTDSTVLPILKAILPLQMTPGQGAVKNLKEGQLFE